MAECPEKTGSSCHDEVDLPKKLFYFYAVNGIIASERARCAPASAGIPTAALPGQASPRVRCSPENRIPLGRTVRLATWPGEGIVRPGTGSGQIQRQSCTGQNQETELEPLRRDRKRLMNEDTV